MPRRFGSGYVLLTGAALLLACVAEPPRGERKPLPGRSNVLIGPTEVCMPPHVWLLLRNANRTCALRIDAVWPDAEAMHARIEAAVSVKGRWRRELIEVAEYPLVGPHPLAFQRGNVAVPCGSFTVEYSGPSCIGLYASGRDSDHDRVAAAPTAWTILDHVDPNEPRLTWYMVDHDRTIEVELAELPGGRTMP
ncbi:MAG TPA: hypothetical protein VEK79_17280 [Thermoanaerobaculia bacterium]|nr:hypothetical protein [Thermoanaerobaculia bacterium]